MRHPRHSGDLRRHGESGVRRGVRRGKDREEHPGRRQIIRHVGPNTEPEGPSWWPFGRRGKRDSGGSFVSHVSEVLDEKVDNAK